MKELINDIIADSDLTTDFSATEMAMAEAATPTPTNNRIDYRREELITIDDASAHDFDDAVGCKRLANGHIALVAAIADVSAYVVADSALDAAAAKRGNSVYLPDRVLPMLPSRLSNDLCSLKAGEDRLCVACEMEIHDGVIHRYRFFRGVMRSKRRLNYQEAAAEMENDGNATATLPLLAQLAHDFRRQRQRRGGMVLETPERYCILSDDEQLDTGIKNRNIAHWAIEEAMIAANRCAADFLIQRGESGLFRTHPKPTASNIEKLNAALAPLGVDIKHDNPSATAFADALQTLQQQDDALAQALLPVVLGTLGRAEYTPDSARGHYGLSCSRYLHFTSPIRRYPDLVNHRAIVALLENRATAIAKTRLADVGAHCSETEVAADKMTWNCRKRLLCVPAKKFIGCVYSGYVSGMSEFGFFVAAPDLGIDGLVRFSSLPGYWRYNDKTRELAGADKTLRLGDKVNVRLTEVNPEKGRADMTLTDAA